MATNKLEGTKVSLTVGAVFDRAVAQAAALPVRLSSVTIPPKPDTANIMSGLDLLAQLEDGSAAAAFFDPQYRGVLDHLGYGNERSRQKARAALAPMDEATIGAFISDLERVLRPSGHLFLWLDKYHLVEGVLPWLAGTQFNKVDMITWDKGRVGMGCRSRRKSEHLLVLQKTPTRAKGIWLDHCIPDVWREVVGRDHAHTKPVELQRTLIAATTRSGDVVVDPAAGSYSVLKACRQVGGRRFYGADLVGPEIDQAAA